MGPARMSGRTPEEIGAEVEEHTEELREALARHGITLPSLGLDAVTLGEGCPFPLVSLGNCNLATVRELVTVLDTADGEGTAS